MDYVLPGGNAGEMTMEPPDVQRPIVVDLGCGASKTPGSIGVDSVVLPGVDLVWDLREHPYPFADSSVARIICRHCIEHFDREDALALLAEAYRMLMPGGVLEITCPHAYSVGAHLDPTHKSYWVFRSFDYFSPGHSRSYYAARQFAFVVENRKTEINLWYDWQHLNRIQRKVNRTLTKSFNLLFSISTTLPDILVKVMPFYYVDIIVELRKPLSSTQDN